MEIKDLTAIFVVAMVGCILVAGFIPVVGESVSATTTFENDGYFRMTKTTSSDETEHTYYFESGTDKVVIDGEDFTLLPRSLSILMWDNGLIRSGLAGSSYYVQLISSNVASLQGGDSFTVTFSAGTVTVDAITSGVTTTRTSTYTEIYYIDSNGAYSMKNADVPAYMHEGDSVYVASDLFAEGVTTAGGYWGNVLMITGDINEVNVTKIAGVSLAFSNVSINKVKENGYNGLYRLNSITFNATGGEPETTTNVTYSYFLVPYEVTAEKTYHADDNTASIISMLPFILIMGIVLMFVGVVLVRRYV